MRRLALVIVALGLFNAQSIADVPIWKTVSGEFSDFEIKADPLLVGDPRFAFLLAEALSDAQREVRDHDRHVREKFERGEQDGHSRGKRNTAERTIQLFALTNEFATVYRADASCDGGVGRCNSSDTVFLFDLVGKKALDPADLLDLRNQGSLLKELYDTQEHRPLLDAFGRSTASDKPDEQNTKTLDDVLGLKIPLDALWAGKGDLQNAIDGVGFTLGPNGRVKALDLYVRGHLFGGHYRLYIWPIDASRAEPLLRPAYRNLVHTTAPNLPR